MNDLSQSHIFLHLVLIHPEFSKRSIIQTNLSTRALNPTPSFISSNRSLAGNFKLLIVCSLFFTNCTYVCVSHLIWLISCSHLLYFMFPPSFTKSISSVTSNYNNLCVFILCVDFLLKTCHYQHPV